MSFNSITRRFRGPGALGASADEPLIGSGEARTFSCPGCARPLAIGQGRCPGCGGYLVAGVLFRTALFLVLVGCVVGMIGGAMIAGVAMTSRLAAGDAARAALAAQAAAAPVATPGPGVAGASAAPAAPVALPAGIAGAALQVATADERLARSAAALRALLAGRPDAADIAPLLRKIAADARTGDQAGRLFASWAPAAAVASDAAALYTSAAEVAAGGLAAALADDAAYVAAARRMVTTLAPLADVDVALRALAKREGITLPEIQPAP